jgi:hypothetical protein
MIAEGQTVLRRGDLVIGADRIEYYHPMSFKTPKQ